MQKNLKEECNAITLRSGKELNMHTVMKDDEQTQEEIEPITENEPIKEKVVSMEKEDKFK